MWRAIWWGIGAIGFDEVEITVWWSDAGLEGEGGLTLIMFFYFWDKDLYNGKVLFWGEGFVGRLSVNYYTFFNERG